MTEACTTATLYWALTAASFLIPITLFLGAAFLACQGLTLWCDPPKRKQYVPEVSWTFYTDAPMSAVHKHTITAYLCAALVLGYLAVLSSLCIGVATTVYGNQAREACDLAPPHEEDT